MSELATGPCEFCPYRKDAPSGLWHETEYNKLVAYDKPTCEQPMAPFMCHQVPANYCFGWVVCHQTRGHEKELLALRLDLFDQPLPTSPTPLFASGTAAAKHGKKQINRPPAKAKKAMAKLVKKNKRLRGS